MDRLTALVALSHLKLRLQMISQHPELMETTMTPTFKGLGSALAKLSHDLDVQSQPLMADIEQLATEAPALLKQAVQRVAETKQAVSDIRDFVAGLGSNGAPTSAGSSDTSAAPAAATAPAADVAIAAQPEILTTNGVSAG